MPGGLVVLRVFGTWIARGLGLLILSVLLAVAVDVVGAMTVGYPPILGYLLHEAPFRGERFDRQLWTSGGSCAGLTDGECVDKQQTCPRGPMVRDLVRNHLLIGTTSREEVLALLGPAEFKVGIEGQDCDDYGLGICSGLGWDYDSLYVCYAEDGTVARAGHVQH